MGPRLGPTRPSTHSRIQPRATNSQQLSAPANGRHSNGVASQHADGDLEGASSDLEDDGEASGSSEDEDALVEDEDISELGASGSSEESDEGDGMEEASGGSADQEEAEASGSSGDEAVQRRLAAYERSRLRYYYAVVECDSVATGAHLYRECDGLEFERSANKCALLPAWLDCLLSVCVSLCV